MTTPNGLEDPRRDAVLAELCIQFTHLTKHIEALTLAIFGDEITPACNPAALGKMVYGLPAVAQFLGCRERHVREHVRNGALPAFRIGGMLCTTKDDLLAFIAARAAAPNGPRARLSASPEEVQS